MNYSAINIQGNIISSDKLEEIRIEDIKYQSQSDFGLDKNTTIRDEIGIAWAAARAYWSAFSLRRDRLKETDSGTSETRQGWMIPFLREMGYDLEKSTAEIIADFSMPYISFNVGISGLYPGSNRQSVGRFRRTCQLGRMAL